MIEEIFYRVHAQTRKGFSPSRPDTLKKLHGRVELKIHEAPMSAWAKSPGSKGSVSATLLILLQRPPSREASSLPESPFGCEGEHDDDVPPPALAETAFD